VTPDHDDTVPRERAVERVLDVRADALPSLDTETVPLESVAGRTLATDVVAATDSPPHAYATMDGFAFDATDPYPLTLVDRSVSPEDDPSPLDSGAAVRIATGAPLPDGANAVLRREDAAVEDGRLHGIDVDPGTYTYAGGSNVSAGEHLFTAGETVRVIPSPVVE
jgi:molybdopterin molybdotransferase